MRESAGSSVAYQASRVAEIQHALADAALDGWLLFDFRGRNPVAAALAGVGPLSRRWFVLIPRTGEPCALIHSIEQGPWASWPWRRCVYAGWRELEAGLAELLTGSRRLAMEISPRSGVPTVDLVPAGVLELVRALHVEVVTSGDLVARFYSRWTADQLAGHREVAQVLARVAAAAFERAGAAVAEDGGLMEGALAAWIRAALEQRGVRVGADCGVAAGERSADPHYHPDGSGARMQAREILLVDLWGKRTDAGVFADQTWMAYLGDQLPDAVVPLWEAVRDARDAGLAFLRQRASARAPVRGFEVDDVVRGVIAQRSYGRYFTHRTGHSLDRELHGSGANLDHYETRDDRSLISGTGFTIEPGIYVPGFVGLRSEINVYWTDEAGPEVTTPNPQSAIVAMPVLRVAG